MSLVRRVSVGSAVVMPGDMPGDAPNAAKQGNEGLILTPHGPILTPHGPHFQRHGDQKLPSGGGTKKYRRRAVGRAALPFTLKRMNVGVVSAANEFIGANV